MEAAALPDAGFLCRAFSISLLSDFGTGGVCNAVFTIGVGLGTNVLGRGDLRGLYQVFALKIDMTRSSFLHIGYNLQNFQTPNYLMLGLGFRFNNKYPKVRH
mgnify:CR=1 FL=1